MGRRLPAKFEHNRTRYDGLLIKSFPGMVSLFLTLDEYPYTLSFPNFAAFMLQRCRLNLSLRSETGCRSGVALGLGCFLFLIFWGEIANGRVDLRDGFGRQK